MSFPNHLVSVLLSARRLETIYPFWLGHMFQLGGGSQPPTSLRGNGFISMISRLIHEPNGSITSYDQSTTSSSRIIMCGRADQLPLSSYGRDKLINLVVGVYIPDSCHLQVRWPIPQYKELFERPKLAHLLLPFLRLCWIRFLTSSVVPVMFLIHTSCHAVPCASIMVALAQSLLAHVPNDHKWSWVEYILQL